MIGSKTIIFGIDGAHFELLRPWIEDGELPNIKEVMDSGVTADLESVLPPVTSPNWKAYATGKNPGKLGIFWWENVDTENERVYYPSERKHHHPELWELISEHDPVGVIGVPTTYPPKQVESFLVAGPPDGQNEGFAHPDEVETDLVNSLDYRVKKRSRFKDDMEQTIEEVLSLIESRYRAAMHLLDEYDVSFLQVTTFYINSLHHYLWDDEYTLRGWKIIDEYVGALNGDDRNVILMSDHGSNEIMGVFNVNSWLQAKGYLERQTTVGDTLFTLGINHDRLVRIAQRLSIVESFRRYAPNRIRKLVSKLPDEEGNVRRETKTDYVDWKNTTAIASGQGPIYLTLDRTDPQYEKIRDELADELRQLVFPDSRPVADRVFYGEEIYEGPYADEAPDLVVDQSQGTFISGDLGRDDIFTHPDAHGWRAENKRNGFFVASGPDFGSCDLDTISILDLAPTLLHLYEIAIPESMDGKVQWSAFATDSVAKARDPKYRTLQQSSTGTDWLNGAKQDLNENLSDLGYLE